jgi:NhaP-type Na+/H+ or K+/H+ antiporter
VRRQLGVRRDYESLYSLGVALAAYAAAEAVHGSGFVAAFIAGLLIAALDVELCDCFLEYGETTAELALLFAFVLFGSSLIWTGFGMLDGPTLAFAAVALLARPAVFLVSLAGSSLELRSRLFVAWFGPRGLSSLLLVLLPAFAGASGSDRLFAICSLVVLLSVALHGGAPLLPIWTRHRLPAASPEAAGASSESPQDTSLKSEPAGNDRISLKELQQLQAAGQHVVLLDARTERTYRRDERQAAGAIRFPPDHVAERAASLGLDPDTWLIVYCA